MPDVDRNCRFKYLHHHALKFGIKFCVCFFDYNFITITSSLLTISNYKFRRTWRCSSVDEPVKTVLNWENFQVLRNIKIEAFWENQIANTDNSNIHGIQSTWKLENKFVNFRTKKIQQRFYTCWSLYLRNTTFKISVESDRTTVVNYFTELVIRSRDENSHPEDNRLLVGPILDFISSLGCIFRCTNVM